MEKLAIIPARGGSKGVPRKNIKELINKPLIAYTIQAALNSDHVSRTIVSTDHDEIARVAKNYGAEVPFIRPKQLAKDEVPTLPVLQHTLTWLKQEEGYEPRVVVLLHPTSPLRNSEHINEAMELFFEEDTESVVSVCEVEHTPYWFKTINEEGRIQPFVENNKDYTSMVRQELDRVYRLNGAIYINEKKVIIEEGRHYKKNAKAYVMSQENSVDIDEPLDFYLAETLLKQRGVRINE